MGATVISHHSPPRKRGSARFGVAAVTLAALAVATWLMLRERPPLPAAPPPPPAIAQISAPALPPVSPDVQDANATAALAGPPPARRPRRTGVPLNAAAHATPDGYEILSAAELDAISQARD